MKQNNRCLLLAVRWVSNLPINVFHLLLHIQCTQQSLRRPATDGRFNKGVIGCGAHNLLSDGFVQQRFRQVRSQFNDKIRWYHARYMGKVGCCGGLLCNQQFHERLNERVTWTLFPVCYTRCERPLHPLFKVLMCDADASLDNICQYYEPLCFVCLLLAGRFCVEQAAGRPFGEHVLHDALP